MSRSRGDVFNVPNLLSFYRLAMAPVIAALALSEERTFFIIFLCISFVTDVLDGLIARGLNLCTETGSRLDSIADELTYVAALSGIFQFEYQSLKPHIAILYAFIAMLIAATLIPMIKFRKPHHFTYIHSRPMHYYKAIHFCLLSLVFMFICTIS